MICLCFWEPKRPPSVFHVNELYKHCVLHYFFLFLLIHFRVLYVLTFGIALFPSSDFWFLFLFLFFISKLLIILWKPNMEFIYAKSVCCYIPSRIDLEYFRSFVCVCVFFFISILYFTFLRDAKKLMTKRKNKIKENVWWAF